MTSSNTNYKWKKININDIQIEQFVDGCVYDVEEIPSDIYLASIQGKNTSTKDPINKKKIKKNKIENQMIQSSIKIDKNEKYYTFDSNNSQIHVSKEWEYLKLHPVILQSLNKLNFINPTPIQLKTIYPAIIENRDIVGAAETGSGKTLAYAIPVIHHLLTYADHLKKDMMSNHQDENIISNEYIKNGYKSCQALIIVPTRELALQVENHINDIIKDTTFIRVVSLIGGMSKQKQERLLNYKPEIVIGTPGRLWDMIHHKHLINIAKYLKFLIIDEADRMIATGNYDEIEKIFDYLTNKKDINQFNTIDDDMELKPRDESMYEEIEYININKNINNISLKKQKNENNHDTNLNNDENIDEEYDDYDYSDVDEMNNDILSDSNTELVMLTPELLKEIEKKKNSNMNKENKESYDEENLHNDEGNSNTISINNTFDDNSTKDSMNDKSQKTSSNNDNNFNYNHDEKQVDDEDKSKENSQNITKEDNKSNIELNTTEEKEFISADPLEKDKKIKEKKISRQTFLFSATLTISKAGRQQKNNYKVDKTKNVSILESIMKRVGLRGKPAVIDLTCNSEVNHLKDNNNNKENTNENSKNKEIIHQNNRNINDNKMKFNLPEGLIFYQIECLDTSRDYYLYYFLTIFSYNKIIIFLNSIHQVRILIHLLSLLNITKNVVSLHAEMQQRQRLKKLDQFISNSSKDTKSILIATDVAARGLDISGIDYIIHYHIPRSTEIFVHRSGRTARNNRKGISLSMVSPMDMKNHQNICKVLEKSGGFNPFNVDHRYLPGIKERIDLAKDICNNELKSGKKKATKNWFETLAKDSELEMDDDIIESFNNNNNNNNNQQDNLIKKKKKILQKIIHSGPIVPIGSKRQFYTIHEEISNNNIIKTGEFNYNKVLTKQNSIKRYKKRH